MKNKKKIIWAIIIAFIGGDIIYMILSNKQSNTLNNTALTSTTTSYSISDLSKHNNKNSCWTAIDGKIFDITSYVTNHPAGPKILRGCGIDGTKLYGETGAHDVSRMVNNYIGLIK